MRRSLARSLLVALLLSSPGLAVAAPAKPEVLRLPRPAEGEWMGLYLQGKKAGWAYSQVDQTTYEGQPAVRATSEVLLSATIGGVATQRRLREERYYAFKDGGALLGFRIEKRGDGGDEVTVGRRRGETMELAITRPGHALESRSLPASAETVDQADPPRLALARHAPVAGMALDEDDFSDKRSTTTPSREAQLVRSGVAVKVQRTTTVEEKDHIQVITSIDPGGRMVEIQFGEPPVMVGKAEPEKTAKQLDKVDLFALTRVALDHAPGRAAFAVPGELTMLVKGLPPAFQKPSARQRYKPLPDGRVEVDIHIRAPARHLGRPVRPTTGELKDALESTLEVESADPEIAALAGRLVGDEHDAWAAAQKLSHWVNQNLTKAYGASSDRATDVLRRRKGDCTEHALLFTALARAVGIPARRVDGLVYMATDDQVPALYWHEWAEVWVGEWVSIDPTFDEPVADATHLALGEEGHADSAALIGQLAISLK